MKVGDKVRILGSQGDTGSEQWPDSYNKIIGKTGIIEGIHDDSDMFPVQVSVVGIKSNSSSGIFNLKKKEVKLVSGNIWKGKSK